MIQEPLTIRRKKNGSRYTYWAVPAGYEGQLLGQVQINSERAKNLVAWGLGVFEDYEKGARHD